MPRLFDHTDPTATDPTATDPTATDPTATDPTATDPDGTEVQPPGSTDANADTNASADTNVAPPGELPNTGGVPVQLLALAMGLVLVGGRLLGASRYWQKNAS